MSNQPQIYISYNIGDKEKAIRIADAFYYTGINVILADYQNDFGENFLNRSYSLLKPGDYLIILLSEQSINSNWQLYELKKMITNELHYRDIIIIPVILSQCKLPDVLRKRPSFNLQKKFDEGLTQLVDYLKSSPFVNFEKLSYVHFENLIYDLLEKLKFKHIKRYQFGPDLGYDMKAVLQRRDPFGGTIETNWIFQIKLYHDSRADLISLKQYSFILNEMPNYYGVLITNGQVTSAAKEWLTQLKEKQKTTIRVIDGVKLKELILKYPDLVSKYFTREGELYE